MAYTQVFYHVASFNSVGTATNQAAIHNQSDADSCAQRYRNTYSELSIQTTEHEAQCLLNMMKFLTSPLAVPTQRSAKMAASASLHSTT